MKKSGFTLVEIMIVVAIIGLLAAIAIPSFVKARTTSQQNACINNLRQIDSSKEQWAMANNKSGTYAVTTADITTADTGINSYMKKVPACPAGDADSYTYGDIGEAPVCSLSGADVPHKL